jgi:hypothetical protein
MHELRRAKLKLALIVIVLVAVVGVAPDAAQAQFGIASFTTTTSSSQAGGHPNLSAGFELNTEALGNPIDQLENASVVLPPGVVGDSQASERCATKTFEQLSCPASAQVGLLETSVIVCRGVSTPLEVSAEAGATTITVESTAGLCAAEPEDTITIGSGASAEKAHIAYVTGTNTLQLSTPLEHGHAAGEPVAHIAEQIHVPLALYNLQPSPGHVATFGASLLFIDILVQVDVRPDGQLVATLSGVSTLLPIGSARLTLWGVPGEASHAPERCGQYESECGLAGGQPQPFTTYPTDCETAPLETELSVDSYQGHSATSSATEPSPTGCGVLQMWPSLSVSPETTQRDTPTGYTIDLHVPQELQPNGIATPDLRDVAVTLPAGTSLSPAVAHGLQACTDAQFAAGACPNASKLGSAEITTPLLSEQLAGGVYLGEPTATERFRVFARLDTETVSIDLTGKLEPNSSTGQLTAIFEDVPQVPFSNFKLSLFGGPSAALANPSSCGPAASTSEVSSYGGQSASISSTFVVDNGEGGACPQSEPFSPTFSAGASIPLAGAFSPFTLQISRADGEQELSGFNVQLPLGVVGMLGSVAPCSEPQAAQGSCTQASEVGSATIGAGAGSEPLYLSGPVFLTGPYDGAPFGLVVAIHASVGPFELGTVVVRSRILVNPTDLDLTLVSDPLPQILAGIPLRLRTIGVTLNRPEFTLNPTSCSAQTVSATVTSLQGASAAVSTPFRVAECGALSFAPRLSATTQARASTRGAGAGLDLDVATPGASAAMRSVAITLPRALRPRLTTIQHACLPGRTPLQSACSAESTVGYATVSTPAIPKPMSGPVYLVAHGGTSLPSLVLVLHGDGVTVQLEGTLAISHDGSIGAAFRALPDVPLHSFSLTLPRGTHSMLGATESLCSKRLELPYRLTSQSGKSIAATARVAVSGCSKHTHGRASSRGKRRRAGDHALRAGHGAPGTGKRGTER